MKPMAWVRFDMNVLETDRSAVKKDESRQV